MSTIKGIRPDLADKTKAIADLDCGHGYSLKWDEWHGVSGYFAPPIGVQVRCKICDPTLADIAEKYGFSFQEVGEAVYRKEVLHQPSKISEDCSHLLPYIDHQQAVAAIVLKAQLRDIERMDLLDKWAADGWLDFGAYEPPRMSEYVWMRTKNTAVTATSVRAAIDETERQLIKVQG